MNPQGTRPQWGIANSKGDTTDAPVKELGRIALAMGKPPAPVETPQDLARPQRAPGPQRHSRQSTE